MEAETNTLRSLEPLVGTWSIDGPGLSGTVRAGAERIGRDPAAFADTLRTVRDILLAALARRPDQIRTSGRSSADLPVGGTP